MVAAKSFFIDRRRRKLGIVRVLLALFVVFAHVGPVLGLTMGQGDFAVQAFFIISGFYMSLILGDKYPLNRHGILRFYSNRLLRILPSYWVVLMLCIALSPWIGATVHFSADTYLSVIDTVPLYQKLFLLIPNLFLVGIDTLNFFSIDHSKIMHFSGNIDTFANASWFLFVPPAWSLGAELWFYSLAPWFSKKSTRVLLVIAFLSVGLRIFIYMRGNMQEPWTSRFFPTELLLFLIGMLLQRFYMKYCLRFPKNIGVTSFIAMIGLFAFVQTSDFEHETLRWIFLSSFAIVLPFVFHFTKNSHWDRRVGELSYDIYIVHVLIILLVANFFGSALQEYTGLAVVLISIAISILMYLAVERPVNKIRQKRARTA